MGKIANDIENCIINMMRHELAEVGFDAISNASNDDIMIAYFTKSSSLLMPCKYNVHIYRGFICPPEYAEGYNSLIKKMESGESINAHLSRTTKRMDKHDLMRYEWGIYHFHLGFVREDDGFMQRTKDVLYAFIKDCDVYFICIAEHGKWEDKDLIEIIHRYYPEAIADCKMEHATLEASFTAEDRKQLRKAHINLAVQLDDGTCYMGPGWGINGTGASADASLKMVDKHREFSQIERLIIQDCKNAEEHQWMVARKDNNIFLINKEGYCRQIFKNWPTIKDKIGDERIKLGVDF